MDTPTRVELLNKDHLPDELARFDGLKLDGNQLKGVEETGETPQLRGLGPILMKTLVELGGARVIEGGGTDPAIQRVIVLLEERNRDLEREKKELQQQLDQRLSQMETRLGELQAKLDRYEEGVKGFMIGDSVGWLSDDVDEAYDLGYIVVGYTDDEKIKIKDIQSSDIYEVAANDLAPENKLEIQDEDLSGFEEGEAVRLRSDDNPEDFEPGYRVMGPGQEPGTIEVIDTETWERQDVDPDDIASDDEFDDTEPSEFNPGDRVGLKRADGRFIKGFEVLEVGAPDAAGKRKIKVKDPAGLEQEYDEDNLKLESEISDDETAPIDVPPESRYSARRGWRALPDRFGGWMLGRQVVVQNGAYNLLTRRGGRRVITEEEAVLYDNDNRRAGIGAVALLAAGGLIAMVADTIEDYFEYRHGVPKSGLPRAIKEPLINNSPIHGSGWEVIPPKGSIPANEAIHFYNGNQGNHGFGLAAPSDYKWQGHPGDYSLTGPNGATVDHIQWKANGPMSDGSIQPTLTAETKRRLLQAFPNLRTKLGQLFYTDRSGPGRHGWVKHYITYLLPKR